MKHAVITGALCGVLGLLSCASPRPTAMPTPNSPRPTPSLSVDASPPLAPDGGEIAPVARPTDDAPCPVGSFCQPAPMPAFPFEAEGDTSQAPQRRSAVDRYACAPDTDESGPEVVYAFEVTETAWLSADLDDEPGDEVDMDLHLLAADDPERCLARHNRRLRHVVGPGRYLLVLDTFVDDEGQAKVGPYKLNVRVGPLPANICAIDAQLFPMRWRECAPGIDCHEREDDQGELRRYLQLPASGPVVKEAHLVTVADDFGERQWPRSRDEGIEEHYERTQPFLADAEAPLREPWAPAGEGGSRWGQGSTGRPVPVEDEVWYITMNWAERPAPGTRMIVFNPDNGRTVVASAGYETGPGSPTAVAGVSEEIHHSLGSGHRDVLVIGFAVHDDLPLGPIDCPRRPWGP